MSEFKGTSGPWVMEVVDGFNTVGVASANGEPICDLYHNVAGWTKPTTKEWKIENARLIAAAPELLEALLNASGVLQAFATQSETAAMCEEMARAAIAKARGEQP